LHFSLPQAILIEDARIPLSGSLSQPQFDVNTKRIMISFQRTSQLTRMPDIYEQIGKQIRELRTTLRGQGISQEELAQAVETTANTVSRWETATYKPSISDLERLARFFGTPITAFFPQPEPKSRTNALLSATADLDDDNLEEVTLYAQFRRTRQRKKRR
jgi:transcriptional regulator with XRE-family HTH domain